MFCAACIWSRHLSGLPCLRHRTAPPAGRLLAHASLPAPGSTVDGQAARPGQQFTDTEARELLAGDIDRYGTPA